ncbi:MAG: hypothetical protein ACRDCX_06005 [Aeromonas sp.]
MSFWSAIGNVAGKAAEAVSDGYYDADAKVFAMSDRELAQISTGQKSAGPLIITLVVKELIKRGYHSQEDIRKLL